MLQRVYCGICVTFGVLSAVTALAIEPAESVQQTIVMVRHAEKPAQGLGLLTCQGLNRALMLPAYFAANHPSPDFIFAPDPSVKATEIHGDGLRYDYVRPLLTIAPTAVQLGVPINTQLPFNDPGLLADTLLSSQYHGSVIYVAWEHMNIVTFAEIMRTRFSSSATIPPWPNSDFNTVLVFRINWSDSPPTLELTVGSQGIDSNATQCPTGLSVSK